MQHHVCVELVGGPEDGRTFIMPTTTAASTEGPESPLPFNGFSLPGPDTGAASPAVRYERAARRPDGVWRYNFTGEHIAAPSER